MGGIGVGVWRFAPCPRALGGFGTGAPLRRGELTLGLYLASFFFFSTFSFGFFLVSKQDRGLVVRHPHCRI